VVGIDSHPTQTSSSTIDYVDWIYVRKHTTNEPLVVMWANQEISNSAPSADFISDVNEGSAPS